MKCDCSLLLIIAENAKGVLVILLNSFISGHSLGGRLHGTPHPSVCLFVHLSVCPMPVPFTERGNKRCSDVPFDSGRPVLLVATGLLCSPVYILAGRATVVSAMQAGTRSFSAKTLKH